MRLLRTTHQRQPGFPAADSHQSVWAVRAGRCLPPVTGLRPYRLGADGPIVELLRYVELPHVLRVFSFHIAQRFQDTFLKCPDCRPGVRRGRGRARPGCQSAPQNPSTPHRPSSPDPANPRGPDRLERSRRRAARPRGIPPGKDKCPRRRWRWPKRARGGGPAGSEPASWKSGPPPR